MTRRKTQNGDEVDTGGSEVATFRKQSQSNNIVYSSSRLLRSWLTTGEI